MIQEMEGCKLKDNVRCVGEISQFFVLMLKLLEMEKSVTFSKKVWNEALKQAGAYKGKNIAKDPMRALNMGVNMGAALLSKNPTAIMSAGAQAKKNLATGKGMKRVGNIQGNELYMRMSWI